MTAHRSIPHVAHPSRRILPRLGAVLLAAGLGGCVTNPSQPGGAGNELGQLLGTLGSVVAQADRSGNAAGKLPTLTVGGTQNADSNNPLQLLVQSFDNLDDQREAELGRQLAAVLLGTKPAVKDAKLQRYVNQLGRWISLHASRPDLPWTFVVLEDPGFNAFAAPGGYVFVTRGLVNKAQTEAELGAVLAHEIIHVSEKHHIHALQKAARAQLAAQLAERLLAKDLNENLASRITQLGKNLYAKGLERGDEFDADRMGVALAARAGLDPYGLPALLQKLAAERPDNPDYLLAFATHPPTQQRLAQLEAAMGHQLDPLATGPSRTVAQRLQAGTAR